ncbi:MAG: MATE family efflux transporter [Pseudomonadota bacterium]
MRESHRRTPLTDGPIIPTLVKMSAQMLVGILGMIAFGLVDTWFVGQLGPNELAAMGYVLPVAMVVMGLSFGLGTGAATVVARAMGQGDRYRVQRLTTDSLTLALVIVAALIITGLLTMEPVFRLLGAGPEVRPLVIEYMQIWYPGMIFVVVPMVGNNAIRALGDTKTPAIIMTTAVLVNLVLDPLLIFGLGPFPRLGIAGAAIATLFARATTLAVAIWALHWKHRMLTFRRPSWREGAASWKAILYVGLPNAATNLVLPVGAGIITRLVSGYGDEAVAAYGVAARIDMFALTPIMALGAVLGPFVGQNWGAGQPTRLREGVSLSLRFANLWGAGAMITLSLLARPLAGLFNDDPAVVEPLALYLQLVPLSYGLRGMVNMAKTAMNALNRPLPGSAVTLMQMFLFLVPLSWAGSTWFGLAGLFAAPAVASILGAAVGLVWMRRVVDQETLAEA